MGLFDGLRSLLLRGRPDDPSPDAAIDAFWRWWREREADLEQVVGKPPPPWLVPEMSAAVRAIHPDLAWEFGSGRRARHALALSGEGDPELRLLAERWRRRGPGDGEVFEFHTSKQPVPAETLASMTLELDGTRVAFEGFRCRAEPDEDRPLLHLGLHHPAFADLPGPARERVAFVALDQALGEDGVERWVGAVELLDAAPAEGLSLAELAAAVERFAAGAPRRDAWILGEGEQDGQRVLYVIDAALKRWDHPFMETWCVVRFPYADRGDGLPDDPEKMRVDALEEALLAEVGDAAVNIGHRTGAGARLLFLYVDGRATTVEWLKAWGSRCVPPAGVVEVVSDPGWRRRP